VCPHPSSMHVCHCVSAVCEMQCLPFVRHTGLYELLAALPFQLNPYVSRPEDNAFLLDMFGEKSLHSLVKVNFIILVMRYTAFGVAMPFFPLFPFFAHHCFGFIYNLLSKEAHIRTYACAHTHFHKCKCFHSASICLPHPSQWHS